MESRINGQVFIDSIIMENKLFNQKKKEGSVNPFDVDNKL